MIQKDILNEGSRKGKQALYTFVWEAAITDMSKRNEEGLFFFKSQNVTSQVSTLDSVCGSYLCCALRVIKW